MNRILIETTLDKLAKGDIFSYSNKDFEVCEVRFHSFEILKGRLFITHGTYSWHGEIEKMNARSFTSRDIDSAEKLRVWIVQSYMISNSEKHKGETFYFSYYQQEGSRVYPGYKVNDINYLPGHLPKDTA